jgi:TrwC relaxase
VSTTADATPPEHGKAVDAMTLTAPSTATGSTLVTVDRGQAARWQQALATLGARLPAGWDASGRRSGGVAGYDLVLATPRTLSALAWFLTDADREHLARPIHQARRQAVTAIAVEFTLATGAQPPTVAGHGFDSAHQPWLHAHLLYGALAATDRGLRPLDPVRVAAQADRHIFGYHLLLRQAVGELVDGELGLGWAPAAPDGSCELAGLPARVLAAVSRPCRPLADIGACRVG